MDQQDRTPPNAEATASGPQARPDTARPQLTTGQRRLAAVISGFVAAIAAIGFAGSYTAVTKLAKAKGFGWFAWALPAGIDAGIGAFLALDLLLTWVRIPFPLLRHAAWLLTAATICFNAYSAWGDTIAVGMHAVVPLLFITAVEAARHATGRVADITADRFIESPPLIRWIIAPRSTFLIWRRMRLWQLTSYTQTITLERDRAVFRARLVRRYGRWTWKRQAADHEVLAMLLSRYGTPIQIALAEATTVAETPPQSAPEAPRPAVVERHESAATPATDTATEAPPAEPQSATESAPEAPRKRSGKATPKRSTGSPRAAARDAIRALYDTLGKRPVESEMVAALKAIKSPYDSAAFAKKIRTEIETEHPELAALGSPNIHPLTGTDG